MRDFLNDYIQTLPDRNRVKSAVVMRRALLEKQEIDLLIRRISNDLSLGNVAFADAENLKRIRGSDLLINFRELFLRMDLFYNTTNDISDLLNSETVTMLSEIKELEKEIDSVEKSIANYSFLLSDGGSFDFGFLEPFSDEINRADDIDFTIPDRANSIFSSDEKAVIDISEGALTLIPLTVSTVPFTAVVSGSNYGGLVVSDSDIQNISYPGPDNGWRVSISSPSPIVSTLPEFVGVHNVNIYTGAQAVIDMTTESPAPIDHIKIVGLSDSTLEVVQITTYSDLQDSDPIDHLTSSLEIKSQASVFFETRTVAKVRLLIRQRTYRRPSSEPLATEKFYRKVYEKHRGTNTYTGPRNRNRIRSITGLSQVFVKNFIRRKRGLDPLPIRVSNRRLGLMRWGPLDSRLDISRSSENIRVQPNWFNREPVDIIAKATYDVKQISDQMTPDIFPRRNPTTLRANPNYEYFSYKALRERGAVTSTEGGGQVKSIYGRIRKLNPVENKTSTGYKYSLGISYVSMGSSGHSDKGVFISKQLPSAGDIGQLKLKSLHTNALSTQDPTLDTNIITSVEYSVTNIARPNLEEHWLPVMPMNEDEVTSERVLFDDKGKAFLRMKAKKNEGITLYKNNRIFPLEGSDIVFSQGNLSIVGIILDPSQLGANDVFTIDYVPLDSFKLIDFESSGFDNTPLSAAFDSNGAGEGFTSTDGQLSATLRNLPYIDHIQVGTSSYSVTNGLTPYQPLTIQLSDGTNAINLTNYIGGTQAVLDANSSSYQFLQKGKTLLFNKAISEPFRVYYEYSPNNVRVRVVLRSNGADSLSTPKVDYFQVKAKTRVANTKEVV